MLTNNKTPTGVALTADIRIYHLYRFFKLRPRPKHEGVFKTEIVTRRTLSDHSLHTAA
jgi:hypothetical protein